MRTGTGSRGGSLLGQTPQQEWGGGSPHQAPVGHHQHDIHPGQPVTAGRHGLPTPRSTVPVYPAALLRQPALHRGNGAWVRCGSPAISLRGKTKADPARKHGAWGGGPRKEERRLPASPQHVTEAGNGTRERPARRRGTTPVRGSGGYPYVTWRGAWPPWRRRGGRAEPE